MKLHPHTAAELAITRVNLDRAPKSIAVAQQEYAHSLCLHGSFGAQLWTVIEFDAISEADVLAWAAAKPELVVLGTGEKHRFLSPKLAVKLAQAGVGLECMNTAAAARTYNVLLDEGRDVLGAFLL